MTGVVYILQTIVNVHTCLFTASYIFKGLLKLRWLLLQLGVAFTDYLTYSLHRAQLDNAGYFWRTLKTIIPALHTMSTSTY